MLRNYILVAIRNMLRQRAFTAINILGLALGMAATIIILLFVKDELSYDRYHENHERIFRVTRAWFNDDGEVSLHLGHVAPPFGTLLINDYEGIIEKKVRFLQNGALLTYQETTIQENRMFFAEEDVFEMFSWPLLKGDPKTALVEPNAMVMTEETARKYFGDEDPIGKQVLYDNQFEMVVTGVAKEVPANSHFQWDILVSFQTVVNFFGEEFMMTNFGSNNYSTFLLLQEGYDYRDLQAQLGDFLDKHQQPTSTGRMPHEYNKLTLWPLADIHLHSNLDSEIEANSDISYVYIYTTVAIFILVIACINFINLTTARSSKRAQEVGVRKAMGAQRGILIRQFITESVVVSVFSLVLAVLIVYLALPQFNTFVSKEISLDLTGNLFTASLLIGIALIVGVLAGSYPAFFLSSFQPAMILKGEGKRAGSKINLRSVLVVAQFTISVALIIGVGIVQNQIDYMRTKSLGFNQSNLIILDANDEIYNRFADIKARLENQDGIQMASLSSRVPSGRLLDSQGTTAEVDGEMKQIPFRVADVHTDFSFLKNLEVEFVAGRDFDPEIASDSMEAFIINEAAVEAIGWTSSEEAIDKRFQYGRRDGRIIGVVEDFHFESLHQQIAPIVFVISSGRRNSVVVRYDIEKEESVLAYLNEQWSFLIPGAPFDYYLLDQAFDGQYDNEEDLATIIQFFSILAIIVAALGLFGLSSFVAEQRIKEIGIRKVMGASVPQILGLLTRGFTVLVVISCVLAAPLIYFMMDGWLQNFAYSGGITAGPFVIATFFALLVAWITVSFQTIKAARANPVESLRYE